MPREQPDASKGKGDGGKLIHAELTGAIISAFYFTYNVLGFGFLESVYRKALALELRARGFKVEEEKSLPVYFRNVEVGSFRTDLFVEGRVMLELKATMHLGPTDQRQLLNCLKAGSNDVGLLLHYGPEPKFYRLVHPRFLW